MRALLALVLASAVPLALPAAADVPARPDDPRAAKAYLVFDTYCARCHQSGKLEKAVPAGNLANILALSDLARNAGLITPGVPDASRLYDVLATAHAPLDVFGGPGSATPASDDISAVRAWIRDMPPLSHQCAGREFIKDITVDRWMEEALRVARDGSRDVRFISLVNLHNACASSSELAAARQAIAKVMNALSWAAAPRALQAVDPLGTLLSFRLQDFGWTAGQWDTLQLAYPKAFLVPLSDATRALAGAPNIMIRGDWLTYAASEQKLYYQLLAMPQKLADLAKLNGVDIDQNVRSARARRALIRSSDVTRGNRMAERHPGDRGGFWLIHDFSSSIGDQDLFEQPLGSKDAAAGRPTLKPGQQRVAFTLPNGFLAFALYDAAGNRIERALPGIEKPVYAGTEETAPVPSGCFSCHAAGIRPLKDDYRAYAGGIAADAPGKDVRDAALLLSATDGELALLSDADNERYRNAQIAAGIDPNLTFAGEELVTGLAQRYAEGTDYEGAASELGLDSATFAAALAKASGETAELARRLQQGRRPRGEIDQVFAYLKGVSAQEPAALAVKPVNPGKIGLEMSIDKPRPALGDAITVTLKSDTDCYLTLINVDKDGKATVLFPNDFEPENLLQAGKPMRIPGAESPYRLKRKEQGRELLYAQCSTSSAPPTGIEHEFSRQRFTVLGNWENFVEDALVTEADLRSSPEKAERARTARAQAMRAERRSGEGADRADTAPGRRIYDGRAVIIVE